MPRFDPTEFKKKVVIEGTEYGLLRGQAKYGTVYYRLVDGVRFFKDCFEGQLYEIEKAEKLEKKLERQRLKEIEEVRKQQELEDNISSQMDLDS